VIETAFETRAVAPLLAFATAARTNAVTVEVSGDPRSA
jgi:hypothetical protein